MSVRIALPIAPPDKSEEYPTRIEAAKKRLFTGPEFVGWSNIDDVQLQGSPKLFMAIQERNGVWCKGAHRIFFNFLKCSLLQDSLQHFVTTQAGNNYEPLEKKAFTIITLWIVCDAHT